MLCDLEAWHPEGHARWSRVHRVDLDADPDGPMPFTPGLGAVRPFHGPGGWVLRIRQGEDALRVLVCTEHPAWSGAWEPAEVPESKAPWAHPAWRGELEGWLSSHVGAHRLHQHRAWGRSTVWRVETPDETLWLKESYGLPPGEGVALRLASQHGGALRVPAPVAARGSRALMRPLPEAELRPRSAEDWGVALRAALDFAQRADVGAWLEAGARDLRTGWAERLGELFGAYGFDPGVADGLASRFDGLPAGVLPQDLGPCNLRWHDDGGPQGYDWTDVVISTPSMLLDRFLDEARYVERLDELEPVLVAALGDEALWAATRRIALLHETWRYHSELAWLDDDAPLAVKLREGNARQLARHIEATHGRKG